MWEKPKERFAREAMERKIDDKLSTLQEKYESRIQELEQASKEKDEQIGELIERTESKEKRITSNQQLLILHYLGLLDAIKLPSSEKKYKLFHLIIDKTQQSVKDFSNYRTQPKTLKYKKIFNEQDLSFVSKVFEEMGLTMAIEKIEEDKLKLNF